jgi:cysteine-rich repeat protein
MMADRVFTGGRSAALLSFIAFCVAVALMPGLAGAASFSSKTFAVCQKVTNKGGQKLLTSKLSAALGCAERILECQLAEELDGDDFSSCASAASAKCDKTLGKIADRATSLADLMVRKCPVDLTSDDLRSRRGLGFRDIDDACADLSPAATADDLASITDCATRAILCRSDEAIGEMFPRAHEVLTRAGVIASYPDAFPCLAAQPASPAAGSTVKDLVGCQKAIHKFGQKKLKTQQKGVLTCSDSLLGCQLPVDRAEDSIADGEACLAKSETKCASKLSKIDKLVIKRDAGVSKSCGGLAVADIQAGLGFGTTCAGATVVDDINACADVGSDLPVERAIGTMQPRTCSLMAVSDVLAGFEDVCVPSCLNGVVEGDEACDDGNVDDADACRNDCTVGPTALERVHIASSAVPAETPDGTPGTAVPGGSTLETQFGSTTFDLNRASYTRFYTPGAGDPDAVLIVIPGFAGGSHSYKVLAENLLVRAEAEGSTVLEVWAYDRRTNQLEDLEGAEIAYDERDALLALNWYFGAEAGLPMDARLPRRAVFHEGEDVAFIANWTPNVYSRDIDAIIEAANALPGGPAVFLGGHSFGTTMMARYASTDFDTGAGVDAGYAKVDGLVLFEGGGSSLPSSSPTSDELDLVIARADGGLFHAVQNGVDSCVDGTPCPGGDADCAGVPLPAGAVTNKCVPAVDAYTGADLSGSVFITPHIHAAGDVTAIQGTLDPDSRSAVQMDFGAGPVWSVVQGLNILGNYPPATTETALGFFLDDDFSPVSAFQASLGFSDNGLNPELLPGIILPAEAYSGQPFRTWKDVDDPSLPASAVPDNGPSTGPNDRWGQEKEVSPVGIMASVLFSDGQNFGDSYFGSSGLGTTSGGVGGLDSSDLSVGRGRPDIENLTQAPSIDVPVIAFGGTNGLTPTGADFEAFASSIGTCTAASCDGVTPRVVTPWSFFFGFNDTVYGDVAGGFEVHLSEGYAHVDILSASDDPAHNNVYDPLMAFLLRNTP